MTYVPPALQEAWDAAPEVHCKGLCQAYCGPVAASPMETRILAERGVQLLPLEVILTMAAAGDQEEARCPALDTAGRCSVYDVRPMICRLFGATSEGYLVCPHGCGPEGGRLTNDQSHALMRKVMEVGQWVPPPRRRR